MFCSDLNDVMIRSLSVPCGISNGTLVQYSILTTF